MAEAMDGVDQSAICGAPPDLATEPRETASRSDWRGKAFLVTSWASKKSLATARRAGETPMRRSRIKVPGIGRAPP
ncbi:hypothetical protein E2P79_15065 [Aeromonas schubertii]|nr:hypothetical protein E2P79_15065 [Aeromonas schubertii]